MPAFPGAAAIEASLEAAAAYGDPAPTVYAHLFARHPEMRALFVNDTRDAVKGEMLARALETLLDYIGDRAYAEYLLRSERSAHDAYGVPSAIFVDFYASIAATLRGRLGAAWTPETDAAWQDLLQEIAVVTRLDEVLEA